MSKMKEAYVRNVSMIDKASGDILGVTSIATICEDLIFLTGANRIDNSRMFDLCLAYANAYINGEPCSQYSEAIGIELIKRH